MDMLTISKENFKDLVALAYNMSAARGKWGESNPCSVGYKQAQRDYFARAEAFDKFTAKILEQNAKDNNVGKEERGQAV